GPGLLFEDELLIVLEHGVELGEDFLVGGLRLDDVLATGELRGLAEAGGADIAVLIEHISDGRAAREARGRVAFATLHGDVEILEVTGGALQLGSILEELLRHARRIGGGLEIAAALDGESLDRLTGLLDSVNDALRPPGLDPDDDDG